MEGKAACQQFKKFLDKNKSHVPKFLDSACKVAIDEEEVDEYFE